jgi:hypothetical protein
MDVIPDVGPADTGLVKANWSQRPLASITTEIGDGIHLYTFLRPSG